ncbi:MAG: peptidylprolyl isomerase [Cocleimonas sp.]|nr:peptidylprolyl isomerase [Cocleimonas sp.]
MYKKIILLFLIFPMMLSAKSVIEDDSIIMSDDEISVAVEHWPSSIREEAVKDTNLRKDYLEQIFVNKKMANEANRITAKEDAEFYWKKEFAIRSILIKLYQEHFEKTLKTPNMLEVAKEKYKADKETYSAVAETRASSHILFKCNTKDCSRKDKRKTAEDILLKLKAGASFEKLVEQYSDDLGTKKRKGSLGKSIALGQPHVEGAYTMGVFSIAKVGQYSTVVDSRFGLHIIRLDGIKKKSYLSFDKVKDRLISRLESEYKKLASIRFRRKFNYSKDVKFDDEALDAIFEKYKTEKAKNI